MTENKQLLFTISDIEDAYRKLKAHFYYDNTNCHMRRKIAEFETHIDFSKKLETLKNDLNSYSTDKNFSINKYGKITYYTQPKSFENNIIEEKDTLIVTNRYIADKYIMKNFNFFIDIPIELHIINVLWIMKLGYLLDSQYCHYSNKDKSYCYANKLQIDNVSKKLLSGNKLFKNYAYQYQKWRDECIEVAEDLLNNHKTDVIIVSLDIKRYYPSAYLEYSLINDDLKIRCENKNLQDDYEKYSFLTIILGEIRDRYYKSIEKLIESDNKNKKELDKLSSNKPIPIGMLSSNIIANWYLRTFDEKVNQYVNPAFYGRYVDDILIVLKNKGDCEELSKEDGICDKACCTDRRKLSIHKILKQYFCGCNKRDCQNAVLTEEIATDGINIDKNCAGNEYNYFITINNKKLTIQGNKVKLFVFDANSTKAMLKKFKDTIRKHSSEFRFLPEEDRIQEDFVQETYSIDYNDTINKLRSIDKYQLDRFKISSYLAKQLMLAKYAKNTNKFNQEEILYAFSGRMGLELFSFWDKVLTYFILNNNENAFCNLISTIVDNIERIYYENASVLNKIKINLFNHLRESIYLALTLNPKFIYKENNSDKKKEVFKKLNNKEHLKNFLDKNNYDKKIKQLLDATMIKHKYCYMPILNYVSLQKSSNYIDFTNINNINELFEFQELLNKDNLKIKYNPKYFSFEEIMLYENYKTLLQHENFNNINYKLLDNVFEQSIQDYILLNYTQYASSDDFHNDKRENIKKYLTELIKNSEKKYIELSSNNDNRQIKLSEFIIGLYNTKVTDDSITKNIKNFSILSFEQLQEYIRFLNLAIQNNKTKCNLIVFPELCIPHQALGLLADFSKKHNVAIVCGLKHITIKNAVLNLIATILPFDIGNYTNSFINLRLKEWYSPSEIKEIKKYGKEIPYNDKEKKQTYNNNLFSWNGLYFATYDCFELADTTYRSEFKSYVDMIIACEWNKDIDYFNHIIKSTARDIHCFVTQVNTSQFGDSKVIAPKKASEMTFLNIKGGEDNILVGKLNIEALRTFQRKETEYLEENEKLFKPLPPAFKKDTKRLSDK